MHRQAAALILSSLILITPEVRAGEVARWNRVATDAAIAEQMDPLNESRVYAIVHAAIHNALNAIDHRYEPYRGSVITVPNGASPEAAAAAAAHAALVELMPARKRDFDAALVRSFAQMPDKQSASAGRQVGIEAAAAMIAQRRDDGASRTVKYVPGKKPGDYRPTPPDFTPALFAQWGQVRPFVLMSSSQFRPIPPLTPTSARARKENEDVRAIGGKTSSVRTAEQSEIARFWYESSPQGWNRIARELAVARKLDEWESARLLALVNFAVADAYVGGFEAKYHYNYWRPATAIRENGSPDWLPYLDTPPLPDYPSNHTVAGAAAATAMARYFGTDFVTFSMTSGAPYAGITRKFWSFSEAAQENGASRVLAGIHFPTAVRAGYEQGERIGAWTYERSLRPVRHD